MRGFLYRLFIEDGALKIISFALAVILFLVRSDWEASTSAYVRIHYVHPADRVVTSELPSEAKIVVRGPWSRTNRFSEAELDPIQIDLGKREAGELRLSEDMVRLPSGLRVGSFSPSSIYLDFEQKVERAVPIQPVIEGEVEDGYRLGKVTVRPATVKVIGAKSAVEAMRNVLTRPVRVTSLRSPVELSVKLAPPPKYVRVVDATLDVQVQVGIEQTLLEQTYTDVQITVTGAAHSAGITLSPLTATILLRGPALALQQLKGTPELVVDASTEEQKPPGTYRKRLQVVNLPPGIAAEIRPDSVYLTTSKADGRALKK